MKTTPCMMVYFIEHHRGQVGASAIGPSCEISKKKKKKSKKKMRSHSMSELKRKENKLEGYLMSELWKNLPPELVARVLIFVPATSQARMRLVCKEWNALLGSSRFREESTCTAFARRAGCICTIMLDYPDFPEYDRYNFKARATLGADERLHNVRVDLGFLPPHFLSLESLQLFITKDTCDSCMSMDADDGLSCIWNGDNERELQLCVVNLANMTCRELPPYPMVEPLSDVCCFKVIAESVGVGGCIQGFQVVGVFSVFSSELDRERNFLIQYSSSTGAWITCELEHRGGRSTGYSCSSIVYKDSALHLSSVFPSPLHGLCTFSASNGKLQRDVQDGSSSFLFEYDGRLIWPMIYPVCSTELATVTIWAISMDSRGWEDRVQVAAMPLEHHLPSNVMWTLIMITCAQLVNDTMVLLLDYNLPARLLPRSCYSIIRYPSPRKLVGILGF